MCPLSDDDSSSRLACRPDRPEPNEFSPAERRLLLQIAHQAISRSLEQRELLPSDDVRQRKQKYHDQK